MGTRNLTAVVLGGEYKVAQYGQWDGYLSGAGHNILAMLKTFDMKRFVDKVARCRFGTQEEILAIYEPYSTNGWMTLEQSNAFNASKYGYLSRDHGCEILQIIYDNLINEDLILKNSIDFAKDSLFCEWAYVIDLDNNVLEVYEGFNEAPLPEDARFYHDGFVDRGYYPVRLVKSYSFDELPENFNDLDKELHPEDNEEA